MVTNELFQAVERGRLEEVRALVENGADLRAKALSRKMPLHLASERGHEDIVRFLVESGAEVNARCRGDSTPLHLAVMEKHSGVVRFLVECGAYVKTIDDDGFMPIHDAVMANDEETIRVLLSAGANKYEPSGFTRDTPLSLARKSNRHPAVRTLLENWPAVVTLRTLCIRKIQREQVTWKGLISPMLLEYPDELEEQQAFLRRKRREST